MNRKIMSAASNHTSGVQHWKWQRLSALLLIPFTGWFTFSIIKYVDADWYSVMLWLENPAVAVALIIYCCIMFVHSQLGLQVIFEDYVSDEKLRRLCLKITAAVNFIFAMIGISSILYIAFI